jgi:hypothetical protein
LTLVTSGSMPPPNAGATSTRLLLPRSMMLRWRRLSLPL